MNSGVRFTTLSVFLAFVACMATGCFSSVTKRSIGDKHRARLNSFVEELRELSLNVPTQEAEFSGDKLTPSLYFHVADPQSNVTVISRQELLTRDNNVNDPNFFSLYTIHMLENLLDDSYTAEPAEDPQQFEAALKGLLDMPYILAYDLIDYRPPTFTENAFDVQPMRMAISLYDRQTKQWRSCKIIQIDPPGTIKFEYKQHEKDEAAASAIREHFRNVAREEIAAYIKNELGGKAEMDSRAYRLDGTRSEF